MRIRTCSSSTDQAPMLPDWRSERKPERGELTSPARFPLIEVSGSSYAMGLQHGKQAATLVHRHLNCIEELTGVAREALAEKALAFLPQIEALSPSLVAEMEGLAKGAGISFEEAVLCQARGDAAHVGSGGCTAFALRRSATADGQLLAGQNLDLEPEYARLAILLRVQPDDGRPEALMLTFAGQLGYSGMNEWGVALFNNSLFDFPWQLGLPRQPLKRMVLETRTVERAVELLRDHRVCSAANVIVCDGEGEMADVEIRPGGTAMFEGEHPDALLHTNHYQTAEFAYHETNSLPDSRPRLARLRKLVSDRWGKIRVETMKRILADHQLEDEEDRPAAICRHGAAGWHSIAGFVAEPRRRRLHVRRGYGCTGTWTVYEISDTTHNAHSG